uniref:DNA primase n=1 Tax=Pithovirus LCPAC101 TaxID=2506586 RepID=A0A481Z2G1_9VIRU|nr:MAG: DNA primase [Pithovirus LCPAC101]
MSKYTEPKWWYSFKPKDKMCELLAQEGLTNYSSNQRALIEDHDLERLRNKLIICSSLPNLSYKNKNKNKEVKKFTFFDSYVSFVKYQAYINSSRRCCFECIIGNSPQKPHFDVDISLEENPDFDANDFEDLKDELIYSIDQTMVEYGIELNIYRDVCIYTSHGSKKYSCHLIIDNYYHSDNKEARSFYDLVVGNMSEYYAQFIDGAVYSSFQQFRIIGNLKYGSDRRKVFHPTWTLKGDVIEYQYPDMDSLYQDDEDKFDTKTFSMVRSSLISWVENCKPLPKFEFKKDNPVNEKFLKCVNYRLFSTLPKIKRQYGNSNGSSDEYADENKLTKNEIMSAIKLTRVFYKQHSHIFPFRFRDIKYSEKGILITFSRQNKIRSYCPICKSIHESDNPFLSINPYNKNIYYMCQRDCNKSIDKTKMFVGVIDEDVEVIATPKNKDGTSKTKKSNKSGEKVDVSFTSICNFGDEPPKPKPKTINNTSYKYKHSTHKVNIPEKVSGKEKGYKGRVQTKRKKISRSLDRIERMSGKSNNMTDLHSMSLNSF